MGPGSLTPAASPRRAASPHSSQKVTRAASRRDLAGQDISGALYQAGKIGCREKLMLKQSQLSLRCPQEGTSPVPANPWGGSELGSLFRNTQVVELLFWRSMLSSPSTSSQQPRTDHIPFYHSSLSSSSIIKPRVPRCWLRGGRARSPSRGEQPVPARPLA